MADREYVRKLVDEVLGADRNKLADQSSVFGLKFTDPQVCKYFLVGFCPYLQFQNTKSDIGNCPFRYHEENLKDQFLAEGERYKEEYGREFMSFLDKLVSGLERKLRKGKDRLDIKPNDPTAALNPVNDEFEERRTILDLQIKETLSKIEQYGEEGRVQEAQEMMAEVDRLKGELDKLRQLEAENPAYRLEKKMEVCQTCGAFLIVGDALKRIEAHFEGRQHNGWARVREALGDLKRKFSAHGREGRMPSPEPGEIGEEPPRHKNHYRSRSREPHGDRKRDDHDRRGRDSRDYHNHHNHHNHRYEVDDENSRRRDYQRRSRSPRRSHYY